MKITIKIVKTVGILGVIGILLYSPILSAQDTLWTKTYGGTSEERAYSVHQTTDNGYIIAGYTNSFGAGNYDVWLIKTNENGDTLWNKTYGGTNDDRAYSVHQTTDNGYIIAGYTKSFGAGNYDVWIIKTDADGNPLWTRTYGGTGMDYGQSVQQTTDSGYIIAGYTYSFGAGDYDFYLIKTNASGNGLWTKTYGGTGDDRAYSVQQTTDNGYIITGYTMSFGEDPSNVWLIKTNENGDTLWTKTYGDIANECGYSVQQTTDNGYIITGYDMGGGAGRDVYLIKTNASGNTLWTKTYGGTGNDGANLVQQTTDDGYIIAGYTNSFGAGGYDVWLLRISPAPEPEILSVIDIPNDQGKWVRITWAASPFDQPESAVPIILYGIWRRIDDDDNRYFSNQERDNLVIAGIEDDILEGWDCVGTVPAIQDPIDNFVSPTLVDSNAFGINYSVFLITAHTQDPLVWFASEPDSGYSIDNIAPEAPYDLVAEVINGDVLLTWQILLSYPDFSHFAIYRDTISGFTPGDGNQIGTSGVSTYLDTSVIADGNYYYVVSALDINGNESDYSDEVEVTLTGIEETDGNVIPTIYALSQNYPNPFKTETGIHYQVPNPGGVTIAIYNVSGQRIKTLVNEHKDAGYYTVRWNGRSQDGQRVSNGVYFCRMVAGEYTTVKKILLTR